MTTGSIVRSYRPDEVYVGTDLFRVKTTVLTVTVSETIKDVIQRSYRYEHLERNDFAILTFVAASDARYLSYDGIFHILAKNFSGFTRFSLHKDSEFVKSWQHYLEMEDYLVRASTTNNSDNIEQ